MAIIAAGLLILGAVVLYLGHKREMPPEKVSESPEKEVAVAKPTEDEPSKPPARGPWLFPDSSSRYLTDNDLTGLDADQLWRAWNEIFARNGYIFSDAKGRAFAASLGLYYSDKSSDRNQDRVFNNINPYEQKNVLLIRKQENIAQMRKEMQKSVSENLRP
jgi:hypothetical protein